MRAILLLSPHLDDVALSSSDHAVKWKREAISVHCLTVFTDFGKEPPSEYVLRFMREQGFFSARELQEARCEEDRRAMEAMGLSYTHLGLTDAAFRFVAGQHAYPDYRSLTPWQVDSSSREVLKAVSTILAPYRDLYDTVVIPLGVGGHVDHWIARRAAERVWPSNQRAYYFDFPYALRPWKYRPKILKTLLGRKLSTLRFSEEKRGYLAPYRSQMPYLFRRRPNYREIVLLPN